MGRPGRPPTVDFYAIAKAYLDIELSRTDGRSTRKLLAERFCTTENAISKRLERARKLGFIPPTKIGRRGTRIVRVCWVALA